MAPQNQEEGGDRSQKSRKSLVRALVDLRAPRRVIDIQVIGDIKNVTNRTFFVWCSKI